MTIRDRAALALGVLEHGLRELQLVGKRLKSSPPFESTA